MEKNVRHVELGIYAYCLTLGHPYFEVQWFIFPAQIHYVLCLRNADNRNNVNPLRKIILFPMDYIFY